MKRLARWGLAALLCATSLVCAAVEPPAPVLAPFPLSSEQRALLVAQPELAALVPIIDQTLAATPPSGHNVLGAQRADLPVDRRIARSTFVFWAAVGTLALLVMAAWVLLLLSQQRRHQQLLKRAQIAEAQSRAMVEAMPATFWMLRQQADGQFQLTLYGSLHLGSTWQESSASSEPRNFDEAARFMPADDKLRFQQLLAKHSLTLTSFHFEYLRAAGNTVKPCWVHVQAVPQRDKTGVVWYGCSIDITERKALEAALL